MHVIQILFDLNTQMENVQYNCVFFFFKIAWKIYQSLIAQDIQRVIEKCIYHVINFAVEIEPYKSTLE